MPDNQNMLALFYGHVLLAFETDKELLLTGNIADIQIQFPDKAAV